MDISSRSSSSNRSSRSNPRYCRCGFEVILQTSRTPLNPGRKFFTCRDSKNGVGCDFFQWLDPPTTERSFEHLKKLEISDDVAEIKEHLKKLGQDLKEEIKEYKKEFRDKIQILIVGLCMCMAFGLLKKVY